MKKVLTLCLVAIAVFVLAAPSAMAVGDKNQIRHCYEHSNSYFNKWFGDKDGDGLMNCLDIDFWLSLGE